MRGIRDVEHGEALRTGFMGHVENAFPIGRNFLGHPLAEQRQVGMPDHVHVQGVRNGEIAGRRRRLGGGRGAQ